MPVRGIRRRYLNFLLDSQERLEADDVWETIRTSIQNLYGIKGLSYIDPNLIGYDPDTKSGIIRCNHDMERYLRVSIAFVTNVNRETVALRVNKSSGTLKTLRKKSATLSSTL